MKCPDSYTIPAGENETQRLVFFNESTVKLVVQDMSNITSIVFDPPQIALRLNSHVTVEVIASDAYSNRNKCKFQVALARKGSTHA